MIQTFSKFTGSLGRRFLTRINNFFNLFALIWRMLKILVTHRKLGVALIRKITLQQIYFTGVEALGSISVIALIMGALIIIQSTEQLGGLGGSEQLIGTLLTVIIIRELGPLMTALIVIIRSGMAVSVEIGYMSVLKELREIEMMGINPLHLLAIPRVIGITAAIICLFVYFDIIALFGGWFLSWIISDVPLSTFLSILGKSITPEDFGVGLVKGLFFGLTISVVCLLRGFSARNAITEVPQAASKASVQCLLYCVVLDVLISVIFYL
jgi:phospholipid/cholesterol/gamma-HCH transport system permease protein